jgi:hypothetical protein
MPDSAVPKDVPKTWAWYGDAIKWFVAIAAALLAFGFDRVKDGAVLNCLWWIYLIGAAALGLSALAGLFAYLQLLGAANIIEIPTDQQTKDSTDKFHRHHLRLGRAYQCCVGALMVGILVSTIAWAGGAWPKNNAVITTPITIERIDPTGEMFVVRRRGNGTANWCGWPSNAQRRNSYYTVDLRSL